MTIDFAALALPFPEEDIEWRIAQAGKKGNGQVWATCLAYVSARAIMSRLDQVCGPSNWKASYSFIPGSQGMDPGVICQLSIRVNGEWVTKEDGAEQTDVESFKGGISSALKRAGSVWGIGRYLYGLETGFARIVDRGTKGAKYGQTKDKDPFYWVPPNLPSWALPEGARAKSNGVHPEDPGLEDGDPDAVPVWTYPVGTWLKRTLEQVEKMKGLDSMRAWVIQTEEKLARAKAAGKTVDRLELWEESVRMTTEYIAERELGEIA